MLPKPNRLPVQRFRMVFKSGKRIHAPDLTCVVVKTNEPVSRFAFIVPTSVAKRAVERNRMKRLMREAVQHLLPTIQTITDGILIAKHNFIEKKESEIELEIKNLFTQTK